MKRYDSIFRIKRSKYSDAVDITLRDDKFLKDGSLVYPNEDFYNILEIYLKNCGLEKISYNNTGTTIFGY